MDDEIRAKINKILDAYDSATKAIHQQYKENEQRQRRFFERFNEIRSFIIEPTMHSIGKQLEKRGHSYSIGKGDISDTRGITSKAEIYMVIYPRGHKPKQPPGAGPFPVIRFRAAHLEGKIATHSSNSLPGRRGSTRRRNKYDIDEISIDIVKHEIVQTLEESLGNINL